jgi:hypothetical protein
MQIQTNHTTPSSVTNIQFGIFTEPKKDKENSIKRSLDKISKLGQTH